MKNPRIYLAAFALLLLPLGSQAQQQRWNDKAFVESSAQFWVGTAVDFHSTGGKREMNPLFRNSEGRVNAGRALAAHAAFYGITVALQRRWPRSMNWTRRIVGWAHVGVAARNYAIARESR